MRVYRLCNTKFASDLFGEGARLHGGRWNHLGTPCVYTSRNRSLAVLELSVNVSTANILGYLCMVEIEIPGDILELDIPALPENWQEMPAPSSTKNYGTGLLNKSQHPVIRIPSSVIPEEFNYLINPKHRLAGECTIIEIKDFVYDNRIQAT